jgi:hypothetical protein
MEDIGLMNSRNLASQFLSVLPHAIVSLTLLSFFKLLSAGFYQRGSYNKGN